MIRRTVLFLALASITSCSTTQKPSAEFPTERWHHADGYDAPYLLAPGDKLEVVVHSAPELSRSLVVAPDGTIQMPLSAPVVAIAHTTDEVADALSLGLSQELVDPDIDVVPIEFASQKIFVGGEVLQQGMFDLPGQVDPLQAVIMAGGFTKDAKANQVVVLRRLPGGEVRSIILDLKAGVNDPTLAEWLPLRRFDVVYVPRTRISAQNQFIQQFIRGALPVEFSLYYDLRGPRN